METAELKTERASLNEKVFNSYSPDDFPGSKKWRITLAAQTALNDFDIAHPEIIAEFEAARNEKNAATAKDAGWI